MKKASIIKDVDIEPDDDESQDDFMERCLEATDGDNFTCSLAWDNRNAGRSGVVRKTHVTEGEGPTFVLSDATPDRMGDIIDAGGWDLKNFSKNPVALFNHNANFPIGKWHNLRVEKGELRGDLRLAPEGTSPRIDEIRRLVEADILRAVSVGFLPRKYEPISKGSDSGMRFTAAELIETSLVSIPANPNALAVAKSLNISRDTVAMVFAGKGNEKDQRIERRGFNGGHADPKSKTRTPTMGPLTKRIEGAQQRIVALRDQLSEHLEAVDDENVTDADLATTQELNKRIEDQVAALKALEDSERRLAADSGDDNNSNNGNGNGNSNLALRSRSATGVKSPAIVRPFSVAAKKTDPLEFLVRAGTIAVLTKNPAFQGMTIDAIRERVYGSDEATKVVTDLVIKAASTPAMTTVAGWAAELVQQTVLDLMPTLLPASVYPSLASMGLQLTFGRNGRIIVPTRKVTPSIAGSFVGEGQPIPVRIAGFASQTLTPKKMAVITTWTREMDEHSIPAIEGLLREAIQQDTAIAIDAVLLDANPSTAVRPAGLLAGVAGQTPTPIAGGAFAAIVGDLKNLTHALLTATNGNIRNMVYIMNPSQALSISFVQPPNPSGLFPFAAEINAGRLNGKPLIQSGTVPVGTIICMDAADFVTVTGDTPRFEISDQATLHMEDTDPAPIDGASPVQSMFQTDSLALRLILPMNWLVRRPGVVSYVSGVTW